MYHARCARTIIELRATSNRTRATARLESLIHDSHEHEIREPLIMAYRAYPSILEVGSGRASTKRILEDIVRHARDGTIAKRAGLVVGRTEPGTSSSPRLTRREEEVLELLRE